MILTHGGNSLINDNIDFLFYTSFSHYNSTTKAETPEIGQSGTYGSTDSSHSINLDPYQTEGPFNTLNADVIFSYEFPQMPTKYKTIVHKKKFDALTGEVWMKGSVNGAYVALIGGQAFILDGTIILLMIPWDQANAQFAIYNNASYHSASTDTQKLVKAPTTTVNANVWNHVAFVYTQTSIYGYINGTLYASVTNQTQRSHGYSNATVDLYGTGSSGRTQMAFLSWRTGDYSTNNHQSFPVPVSPYIVG